MDTGNLHVLNVTKDYDIEQINTLDEFRSMTLYWLTKYF